MRALITQRQVTDKYGVPCDMLESLYPLYFRELDTDVVPVSNFVLPDDDALDGVDFLILTGGGDVPHRFYYGNGTPDQQPQRDIVEERLFRTAMEKNVKVLGICRGMQFINGISGGKVSTLNALSVARPVGKNHTVLMRGEEFTVNNFHNDGVYRKDLAENLEILAEDRENDVVEAFVARNILGLQWHPERFGDDSPAKERTKRIIIGFLKGEKL